MSGKPRSTQASSGPLAWIRNNILGLESPAPKRVVHFTRRLPVALIAALLIAGVVAIDVVPATAGPTASVAKKKCSKKKRRSHLCHGQGGPVAALTALLAGSRIYYLPSVRAADSAVISFCRNGTFQTRTELSGYGEGDYVRTTSGTWKITAAHVQNHGSSSTSLDGNVHGAITSWQEVGPGALPAPQLPVPIDGSIKHPSGGSSVTYGEQLWTLSPGGAGC